MKTNQLTLLRDIKTVDQLIIKLNELGYTRGDDFEDEEKDWGMINKYLVSEMDEYTRPGDFESIITINLLLLNQEGNFLIGVFVMSSMGSLGRQTPILYI